MFKFDELKEVVKKSTEKYAESMDIMDEIKPKKREIDRIRKDASSLLTTAIYQDYGSPDDFINTLEALDLTIDAGRIRRAWDKMMAVTDPNNAEWYDVLYNAMQELSKKMKKDAR